MGSGPFWRANLETQALLCEIKGHWIQAAIIYIRIGEEIKAMECEMIASAIAENDNIKLIEATPITVVQ